MGAIMQLHKKNLQNILPWAQIIADRYGDKFYTHIIKNNNDNVEKYFSLEYLDGITILKKDKYWRVEFLLNNKVPAKYIKTISNPANYKLATYYDAVIFVIKTVANILIKPVKKKRKTNIRTLTWNHIDIEVDMNKLNEELKNLPINLSPERCLEFFSDLQTDLIVACEDNNKTIFDNSKHYIQTIFYENDIRAGLFNYCVGTILTHDYSYYPDPITVECSIDAKLFKKMELDIIKETIDL